MDTRTILVADDSADDVTLMQRAFRKAGSRAALQFVPDGEAALAYLRGEGEYNDRTQHPFPALLLLDLKMPRKNGLEVLEAIRHDEQLKRLTVVVLTSSHQPRDIDLALELGANSYLVKPTDGEALVGLLQRVEDYWLRLNHGSDAATGAETIQIDGRPGEVTLKNGDSKRF
jgi:CheY-like chemotaxis protein